jgi:hypothetical protein
MDLPQVVEQLRVHADLLLLPPVAEVGVQLLQRLVVEAAVLLVGDGEVFVGVDVVQAKRAGLGLGMQGSNAAEGEK